MCCLQAFRLGGGLEKLLALLGCPTDPAIQQGGAAGSNISTQQQDQQADADTEQQQQQQKQRRLQRKVLALLHYVLAKHPTDGFAAAEFGVVPRLQLLLSDADTDMRGASLAVLSEVVSMPQGWNWVKQHCQDLLPRLQQLQQQQQQQQQAAASSAGAEDDGDAADEEEQQLLQKLIEVLQAPAPPSGGGQGLNDHIDLDPHQVRYWAEGWGEGEGGRSWVG
jgi:hypothetical protein